jgi:hypothetical protein
MCVGLALLQSSFSSRDTPPSLLTQRTLHCTPTPPRQMRARSVSQGKTFMIVGATFSAIECTLEKLRGKKDMKNAIVAGFSTGALLAARAGPAAMMLGGGGFAAFSVAIELASPWLFGH